MNFKKWLLEVGMGGGGAGGGLEPIKQNPLSMSGAWADYHSGGDSDPKNPNGQSPPVKKKIKFKK